MEASFVHADVVALTKVLQFLLLIALPKLELVQHSLKDKIIISKCFSMVTADLFTVAP